MGLYEIPGFVVEIAVLTVPPAVVAVDHEPAGLVELLIGCSSACLRGDTLLLCPEDEQNESRSVELFALSTGQLVRRFTPPRLPSDPWAPRYECALSPDGRRVFLAHHYFREWGQAAVYDVSTGRRLVELSERMDVVAAAWSPRGDRIAVTRRSKLPGYAQSLVEEYDAATGARLHAEWGSGPQSYSPDGALRVVANGTGGATLAAKDPGGDRVFGVALVVAAGGLLIGCCGQVKQDLEAQIAQYDQLNGQHEQEKSAHQST